MDQIRAAGGEIYAITSEPQQLASQAQSEWELAFESIGDPHHEISDACRERGLLELFVNDNLDLLEGNERAVFSHPKGYFQPGVLDLGIRIPQSPSQVLKRLFRRRPFQCSHQRTSHATALLLFERVQYHEGQSAQGNK